MNEINYMLDKLYKMNTYLGGKAVQEDFRSGNVSEFQKIGKDFLKKFSIAQKFQNRRNQLKVELIEVEENPDDHKDVNPTKLKIAILDINSQIAKAMTLMENYIEKMETDLRKYKKGKDIYKEGEEIIYKCKKLLTSFRTAEYFYIDKNIEENDIDDQEIKFERDLLIEDIDEYEFSDEENGGGGRRRRRKRKKKGFN